MGAILDWIEKELSPPGIRAKNRQSLYRIIARIGEQIVKDIATSKREFFVRLAHDINAHGLSKGIPRLPYDTDDTYRSRLVGASGILSSTGEVKELKNFLDAYVPGRWRLIDPPRDHFRVGFSRVGVSTLIGQLDTVVIYVTSLTETEKADIKAFLGWFLGADLAYVVSSPI